MSTNRVRIQNAIAKLNIPRSNWINNQYTSEYINQYSQFETPWSENLWWLSSFNNTLITSTNNKRILRQLQFNQFTYSFTTISTFDISTIENILGLRSGNLRWGQGCQFTFNNNNKYFIIPVNNGINSWLVCFQININTELLQHSYQYVKPIGNGVVNWIAIDPISNHIFVPKYSYSRPTNISHFDIYDVEFPYFNILQLPQMAYISDQINAQCGVFSNNGVLYLLDNRRNTSGVRAYSFGYDNYYEGFLFTKRKTYRITKPDESILSSDSQDMVGITFVQNPRRLMILFRNEDVGTDNFYLLTIRGLM